MIELEKDFNELKELYDRVMSEKFHGKVFSDLFKSGQVPKNKVKNLYNALVGLPMARNCENGYFDAITQIMLKMRGDSDAITKAQERINKNKGLLYELKRGVIRHDPSGDPRKMLTSHTITNELAEWYLKHNPKLENVFSRLPDDWKERAARARDPFEPTPQQVAEPMPPAEQQTEEELKDNIEKRYGKKK